MSMYGKYDVLVKGKPSTIVTDFEGEKTITVQADRDEADINKIIAKFEKTGTIMSRSQREPFYGDVTELGNLEESLIKVQKANELFYSFPAGIRDRFKNNPVNLIDFLADEKNRPEALELGLIDQKVEEPIPPVTPNPE